MRKTDTAIFRIDLIGSVTATMLDGTSLLPVGAKTRGVLAVLAMADRKPVSRKLLAGLLWSQRPDEQARASLRQEIHRLTEALK
ncbi:MAG: helix-turn-helix domain-containing protein, partial [Acetobacter sp.]|nr:helix-turn-helix domain-containing protein [Acetobacter sp.]